MKLLIKLSLLSLFYLFTISSNQVYASQNPEYRGYVRSQTGAPVAGASVRQTAYAHPYSCTADENGNPTGCYDLDPVESANRYTTTDENGYFYFGNSGQFNCISNPQVFRTSILNGVCQDAIDDPSNFSRNRDINITCQVPCSNPGETNPHGTCDGKSCLQVDSCGVTTCKNNVDCGGCLPGEAQPHLACVNQSCQPVDSCGAASCVTNQDCCPSGQITPHLACVNQSCQPVNTCGASTCATTNDCCPSGQVAPHQECEGTNCKAVDSCGPPIVCTKPGETVPHGECNGVACKQVNTCGVTSCTEDKQCYSDDMCKCDGFNAINLKNPSSSQFEFEAFAKVENSDISKAKVESIQFKMIKTSKSSSNQNAGAPIAESAKITPEIVSSTNSKVRFRAAWKINPPSYDPNATYRVFSQIKCAPKATATSSSLDQALALATNRLYSSDTANVLGENLNYSPAKLVQNNYLELGTLDDAFYTRIIETDACSAIRFEYGQY